MRDTDLLQMALGLLLPWLVVSSTFDAAAKRLDIHLDFPRGSRFAWPDCGAADNVSEVCIDMSAAFIKGTAAHLPNANITFDKFHAVKIINDAVDLVRRADQKGRPELQKTRYIWLKNGGNLSEAQLDALGGLTDLNLKTARAYQIRLTFQDLYAQSSREAAEAFLKMWYFWATHSRLKSVIEAARTVKRHWDGILRWFDSKTSSKASTASSRPPKPRPGATAQPATSRRYLPDRRAPGNQATHLKQRGAIFLCPFQYPQSAEP